MRSMLARARVPWFSVSQVSTEEGVRLSPQHCLRCTGRSHQCRTVWVVRLCSACGMIDSGASRTGLSARFLWERSLHRRHHRRGSEAGKVRARLAWPCASRLRRAGSRRQAVRGDLLEREVRRPARASLFLSLPSVTTETFLREPCLRVKGPTHTRARSGVGSSACAAAWSTLSCGCSNETSVHSGAAVLPNAAPTDLQIAPCWLSVSAPVSSPRSHSQPRSHRPLAALCGSERPRAELHTTRSRSRTACRTRADTSAQWLTFLVELRAAASLLRARPAFSAWSPDGARGIR